MTHPIVAAATDVRASLKAVADANPTFMTAEDKAVALHELVAAEAQLAELRLRILGDAGDLAEQTAARDAAGWLAHHTRARFTDARADLALATALDRERPALAAAMREGAATLAQAHVIHRALAALPTAADADTVARAEVHLVDKAAEFGPTELGRIGRRILDVVAPDVAEAAEAARLADLEADAVQKTRLTLRRLGDGTTRISGRISDHAATRLATYLESYANPRGARNKKAVEKKAGDAVARLAHPRRMGEAFVRFLEVADPSRGCRSTAATRPRSSSPSRSRPSGPSSQRRTSSAADLVGGGLVPGDDLTGDRITAAQARRLACTAKVLPAVLGGESLPLDLGRTRRLVTPAQREALLVRDRTCRAEGCDVPGTWCDAHHLDPWHAGGRTDLERGVLLCSHHHHRIHDESFRVERLANGDHRFHRRR